MKLPLRVPRRRGFAFLTLIMLAAVFIGLAGALGSQVLTSIESTRTRMAHSASRYAAYAGLQHLMLFLKTDPTYNQNLAYEMPGNPNISYTVELTNNWDGASPVAPDGTSVPPGAVYCAAMGVSGGTTVMLHAVTGILAQGNPTISHAAFTESSLALGGQARTASYDPASMTFSLGADGRAVPDSALNAQGDVGTNRYASLEDSALIDGDLFKPSTLVSPALSAVTGDVVDMNDPVLVPVLDPPTEFGSPAAPLVDPSTLTSAAPSLPQVYESLNLSTGKVTVGPGRYFFPNGIDINGEIELASDVDDSNPVMFFVGNDARFGDAARVNVRGATRNFQMVMVDLNDGTPQQLLMEGRSQIFGSVLGGKAEAKLEGLAGLFGGYLGRSLSCQGSSQVVYDESLSAAPLQISTQWGMHGVTEPAPETILKVVEYSLTRSVVAAVKNGQSPPVAVPIGNVTPQK